MPPTLADRVIHILEAIATMESLLAGKTQSEFAADYPLRLTIERLFEIISEACRHIPGELRASEPGIPWRRVNDLGNWLRHAYHRINTDILWAIARDDIPLLKAFVQRIVDEEKR